MRSRPVAPRASRIADMVASVPELTMRTRSTDGSARQIASASSTSSARDGKLKPDKMASAAALGTSADFFAGIGLMRMGLHAGGWRTVWANDYEATKRRLYVPQPGRRAGRLHARGPLDPRRGRAVRAPRRADRGVLPLHRPLARGPSNAASRKAHSRRRTSGSRTCSRG